MAKRPLFADEGDPEYGIYILCTACCPVSNGSFSALLRTFRTLRASQSVTAQSPIHAHISCCISILFCKQFILTLGLAQSQAPAIHLRIACLSLQQRARFGASSTGRRNGTRQRSSADALCTPTEGHFFVYVLGWLRFDVHISSDGRIHPPRVVASLLVRLRAQHHSSVSRCQRCTCGCAAAVLLEQGKDCGRGGSLC